LDIAAATWRNWQTEKDDPKDIHEDERLTVEDQARIAKIFGDSAEITV
jgi:hypothetical protein